MYYEGLKDVYVAFRTSSQTARRHSTVKKTGRKYLMLQTIDWLMWSALLGNYCNSEKSTFATSWLNRFTRITKHTRIYSLRLLEAWLIGYLELVAWLISLRWVCRWLFRQWRHCPLRRWQPPFCSTDSMNCCYPLLE